MMKKYNYIILCVPFLFLTGCAFFKAKEGPVSKKISFEDSNKIFNRKLFSQGRTLFIEPFNAGPNVAATEKLDAVALLMARSIIETINNADSRLKAVTSTKKKSDFIIKGHITAMNESGRFNKLLLRNKERQFGVRGQLIYRRSNKIILNFSKTLAVESPAMDYNDLANEIGQQMAEFILAEYEKN